MSVSTSLVIEHWVEWLKIVFICLFLSTVPIGHRKKRDFFALWSNASVLSSRFTCHHMCLCRCAEPVVCAALGCAAHRPCHIPSVSRMSPLRPLKSGSAKAVSWPHFLLLLCPVEQVSEDSADPSGVEDECLTVGLWNVRMRQCTHAQFCLPPLQRKAKKVSEAHHDDNSWQMISEFHDASLVEFLEMERELKPSICYNASS